MSHRSFLFTPPTRLDRLAKAQASGADWVILDLEDGVAPQSKDSVRDAIFKGPETSDLSNVAVRINALCTLAGLRDLAALVSSGRWPGMIVIPKVETRREVEQIHMIARESGKNPMLFVTLESASAVEHAPQILTGLGPNTLVAYGSADHTAETGSTMSQSALAWARGRIINACAMAELPAIDGVCLEFRDEEKLIAETEAVRDMGFSGKIAIHPAQIDPINTVMTPSAEAVARAQGMVAAAEQAAGGAFSFNGKMVDAPVLAQAHRTLAAYKETQK